MSQQMWGGRFESSRMSSTPDNRWMELNTSLPYDRRLFTEDIDGSKAYAEALKSAGFLTESDCEQITKSLEYIRLDWLDGRIIFLPTDEDVHTVNERRLTELIGDVALRLHTGRSRNDQIITDLKLWMRKAIRELINDLFKLMRALMEQAEEHVGKVIMPSYTHLQRAQPVQYSHWLLSHAFAFREDCGRLTALRKSVNIMPLGSGAVAGNPLRIDRERLAKSLGFDGCTQNSMHAIGDRDFVIDFIHCCSLIGIHLSRLAEDVIIYCSKEFNFLKINERYCTGSSLMPQKRNPDSMELVRGTSGLISACLTGILITMKGTPSAYNRDYQFDKKYCFDAFDHTQNALVVTAGVMSSMEVNRHPIESALSADMLTTDWTYYLVRKGIPFRKAHQLMGEVVLIAERHNVELNEIPLGELQAICPEFDVDIVDVVDHERNVEQYDAVGGTSTKSVLRQLQILKEFIQNANN